MSIITFFFCSAISFAAGSKLPQPSISDFKIRPFTTEKLDNGLQVMWTPDTTLPYVSLQLMIKSGSAQDPAKREGLASFTGLMLSKGTTKRAAQQISEELEQIGSGFSASVENDYSILSASSLSFNRDELLKNFSEILLTPTFPHVEIERTRVLLLGGLKKMADRPQQFIEYLMNGFVYGSHPYGHDPVGSFGGIKAIKKADLQHFYSQNYIPNNATLAVVGQYDDAFKRHLRESLAKWKHGDVKPGTVPDFPNWEGYSGLLVERPDLNQAQIEIAFKGVPRDFPEYLEVRAALKILGESFGSRLFDEIREKRGLTYHINAWFEPRMKPGPMGIYTFTRTDKIGETIQETLRVYKDFVKNGVRDEEVAEVKALMRGQFPRIFETPEALAQQLLILNIYGVPVSYLENYFRNVDLMTKESIDKAIQKYFTPDNLKVLVYAPKEKAESVLKTLGPLEIKNYRSFL